MQRFVLRENIRRFQKTLSATAEPGEQRVLRDLILSAERELALLDASLEGVRRPRADIPTDQLEAARAEMIAWFRASYGEAPTLAALIDPAPGLAIVEVNRTYEVSSGKSLAQIAGRPLFEVFPDNPNDPTANGVNNLYASLRATAESGQIQTMALQRYDTQDDDGVWTARYWRPVNTPLHDDDGRLVFLLHVVEEADADAAQSSAA